MVQWWKWFPKAAQFLDAYHSFKNFPLPPDLSTCIHVYCVSHLHNTLLQALISMCMLLTHVGNIPTCLSQHTRPLGVTYYTSSGPCNVGWACLHCSHKGFNMLVHYLKLSIPNIFLSKHNKKVHTNFYRYRCCYYLHCSSL